MPENPGEFDLGFQFEGPRDLAAPLEQAGEKLARLQNHAVEILNKELEQPARISSRLANKITHDLGNDINVVANTVTKFQNGIIQELANGITEIQEYAAKPIQKAAQDYKPRSKRNSANIPESNIGIQQPLPANLTQGMDFTVPQTPSIAGLGSEIQLGNLALSCERVLTLPPGLPPLNEVQCFPPPMPDEVPSAVSGHPRPQIDVSAFYDNAVGMRFPWLDEWIRRYIFVLWYQRVNQRPNEQVTAAEWQLFADIACSPAAIALEHGIRSCVPIGQPQPTPPPPTQPIPPPPLLPPPPPPLPPPPPPQAPAGCDQLPSVPGYRFYNLNETPGTKWRVAIQPDATGFIQPDLMAAKAVCESCGGVLQSGDWSGGFAVCYAGVSQPPPPPTPPPTSPTQPQNCCCCNCQHPPSQECPPGTVKIDGICKVPDSAKKWVAYYSKEKESCYTVEAGKPPQSANDILSGTGDTREGALLAAGDICKPKGSESPGPGLPEVKPPIDDYCNSDQFVRVSQAETQGDIQLAAQYRTLDAALKNWKPFDVKPDPNFRPSVWISDSLNWLGNSFKGLITFDNKINKWILEFFGVKGQVGIAAGGVIIAAEFLKKYVGGPWDYLITPAYYLLRRSRPMTFPSVDDARKAFLTNSISEPVFRSWCEINGYCYEPQKIMIDSEQQLPGTVELIQMLRRGLITHSQFVQLHKAQGMIQTGLITNIEALSEAVPAVSDLVRMMVRDVENENVNTTFQTDTGFTENFQGEVAKWAKWQGVSPDFMRRVWRAHWSIPSPGQLFAMWHRNSRRPEGDPARVTYDDIKTALIQQDILPFWIPKILATSYSRLTRVDVRRAFEIGAIGRDRVLEFFRELGYDDHNSELLTKYTEKQKIRSVKSGSSIRDYLSGAINEHQLRDELTAIGVSAEDITSLVEYARRKFKRKVNARCMSHLRKRAITGELTHTQIVDRLVGEGYDTGQATAFADAFKCEASAIGKEFTATQNLRYMQSGLLTPAEVANRLQALGYEPDDVMRMITDAARIANIKMTKQAEADAKKEQQRLANEAKQREKTAAQIDRQAKAAAAAGKAREAAISRRDKALLKAASQLADCNSITLTDAFDSVKAMYRTIRNTYPLSLDEALQAVVVGIERCAKEPSIAWDVRVDQIARELAEPEDSPQVVGSNGSVNVSG